MSREQECRKHPRRNATTSHACSASNGPKNRPRVLLSRSFLPSSYNHHGSFLPIITRRIRSLPSTVSWEPPFLEEKHFTIGIHPQTHSPKCTSLPWSTMPLGLVPRASNSTRVFSALTPVMDPRPAKKEPHHHQFLAQGLAVCRPARTRRMSTSYATIGACWMLKAPQNSP